MCRPVECIFGGILQRLYGTGVSIGFAVPIPLILKKNPLLATHSPPHHKDGGGRHREHVKAYIAADRVGYESSSQFSREFKRYFGQSPAELMRDLRV